MFRMDFACHARLDPLAASTCASAHKRAHAVAWHGNPTEATAYDAPDNMTPHHSGAIGLTTAAKRLGGSGELVWTSGSLGSRTFGYDAFGMRWYANDGAQPRYEVREGSDLLNECQQVMEDWVSTCWYTHGPTGLVNQKRAGTSHWYHTDGLGSVWALTNSVGNVTDKYAYNAYGET
jgi:hypothetical protein